MTRVLVDTHAFLWFVFDDDRLSAGAAAALADPTVEKALSIASLWEIAIKLSIGKLELGMDFASFLSREVSGRELDLLAIVGPHLVAVAEIPFHHRDPFDRLIIAQANSESLPIVTADPRFAPYGVEIVW